MEQITIFRAVTIEDLQRDVNHWLERNEDKQVVDMPMVYEPPRPTRSPNEIPDQEGWLILVRFETNATRDSAPPERPQARIKGAMAR